MNALINDYTKYHVVLVVVGSLLVLMFALLSVFSWTRCKRAPKADKRRWTFEKKVYFSFGIVSSVVGLLIALVVAANATNAFNPQHGFSLLVDSLAAPKAGTHTSELYRAFNAWVQSDSNNMPAIVQQAIRERIAFQATSAIASGILLVVFVALSARIWSALIKWSRVSESKWRLKDRALLASGVVTVSFSLLLMVVVVRDMQGAFAPITLTLLNSSSG